MVGQEAEILGMEHRHLHTWLFSKQAVIQDVLSHTESLLILESRPSFRESAILGVLLPSMPSVQNFCVSQTPSGKRSTRNTMRSMRQAVWLINHGVMDRGTFVDHLGAAESSPT